MADVRRILREDSEIGTDALPAGISLEDVVAYHHGELPEARAAEVRTAVLADPEWERTLREADDLEALAADSGIDDPADIDTAWTAFQARLAADGMSQEEVVPQDEARPASKQETESGGRVVAFELPSAESEFRALARPWWQTAAALVLGVLLGVVATRWIEPARGEVRLVELEPIRPEAGPMLGDESARPIVAPDHDLLVLRLWPPTRLERPGELPPTARLRLVRGGDVDFDGIAEWQDDAYVASVPGSSLRLGDYEIQLDLDLAEPDGTPEIVRYELSWRPGSH